ncbi:heme oxygenase [Cnuella takakiae]|uniref:Heme oxygenase n=1 Tax=Cnuella takakiae TaxID=1302690 RepID=A0A1M4YJN0_9BACT|nr:biliverdin-producing heme oxygenase [Cnuella takakiae]OLY93163.1 hypothetical protein BUE76_15655 [Cnuella takakiae]SHF05596.1 heme oxygenase [Cnuella takakiae]
MLHPEAIETCAAVLKRQTQAQHQLAETTMMPLIHQATSSTSYARLLKGMYGFYQPLEEQIAPFLPRINFPLPVSNRAHHILTDLQVLGVNGMIPLSTQLPLIESPLQALGALYVLEGSALGGRIIARMLRKQDSLPDNAFHFFEGHQENTGAHWQAFIRHLNQFAVTTPDIEKVSGAANETFAAHTRWMKTV